MTDKTSPSDAASGPNPLQRTLQQLADDCGQQHHPQACLYMVATPIGNRCDISPRALHVLALADVLACEDTRHTAQWLRSCGLEKAPHQYLAAHQHNELEAAQTIVARLAAGARVAYVSDAGTPGISDPGARLCAAARAAGYRVMPLPGASSVTAALSAAGAVDLSPGNADTGQGFVFHGFLPSKSLARAAAVQALSQEARTTVLLEAPHRIEATAQALALLGQRPVTVARELSKQFEQLHTLPAQDLAAWLASKSDHCRGEFVLVLHPWMPAPAASEGARVLALLRKELPLKTAAKLAAEISGESKNDLYSLALCWQADSDQG
jgi:16S rRNA (cytidine1402-2'-O)-methyltransferase